MFPIQSKQDVNQGEHYPK